MADQKPIEAIATVLLAGAAFLYFTGRLDGVIASFHRMGAPSNPPVEEAALAVAARNDVRLDAQSGAVSGAR